MVGEIEVVEIAESDLDSDGGFAFHIDVEDLCLVEIVGETESPLDRNLSTVDLGPALEGTFLVGGKGRSVEAWQRSFDAAEGVGFDIEHLQEGKVESSQFLVLGIAEIATGLEATLALSGQDNGNPGGGVVVAVTHARSVENHAVVEKGAVLVAVGFHSLQQVIELLHVPETDLEQAVEILAAEVPEEVGQVVVLLLHAEEIEDHPAVAVPQHVRGTAGGVRPQGQGHQIEHGLDLLIEVRGVLGAFESGEVDLRSDGGSLEIFETFLGLPDHGQVLVENVLVLPAGATGERLGIVADPVEQAGHFLPLLRMTHGTAKEPVEDELGIALPRDRLPLGVVGNVAATDLVGEEALGRQFQGSVWGVAADLVRNELVG